MKLKEFIAATSLKAAGRSVGLEVEVVEGHLALTPMDPEDPRYCADFILPTIRMVEACRADDFDFFQPFIEAGRLTEEQMHHAAARYYLGKTRSGKPIYWMIDETCDPQDAHIGPEAWMSALLKARESLLQHWCPTHCLFGQHLLNSTTLHFKTTLHSKHSTLHSEPIAIVESEASAAVLSELFPEVLWMAYATEEHLEADLFAPLAGHTVTLYPHTDPSCYTYLFFLDLADAVRQRYDIHITVASILEDLATPDQKGRCIDLLDFLRESLTALRDS